MNSNERHLRECLSVEQKFYARTNICMTNNVTFPERQPEREWDLNFCSSNKAKHSRETFWNENCLQETAWVGVGRKRGSNNIEMLFILLLDAPSSLLYVFALKTSSIIFPRHRIKIFSAIFFCSSRCIERREMENKNGKPQRNIIFSIFQHISSSCCHSTGTSDLKVGDGRKRNDVIRPNFGVGEREEDSIHSPSRLHIYTTQNENATM